MKNFDKQAQKAAYMIEELANIVCEDENVKEYFAEAYGYLDGDSAETVVLEYIKQNFLLR